MKPRVSWSIPRVVLILPLFSSIFFLVLHQETSEICSFLNQCPHLQASCACVQDTYLELSHEKKETMSSLTKPV